MAVTSLSNLFGSGSSNKQLGGRFEYFPLLIEQLDIPFAFAICWSCCEYISGICSESIFLAYCRDSLGAIPLFDRKPNEMDFNHSARDFDVDERGRASII